MNTEFYTFGEILWDCLPSGRHAGGAPFNVAAHLAQLGTAAYLISSVGQDALGDEILQVAHDKKIHTRFVTRARADLPTGTVQVTLDENANATYQIVQPVAWDDIDVSQEAVEAVASSRALVFGSLAGRSQRNRDQLARLLDLNGPLKCFDVNLRPPFSDPELVFNLAKRADVLKLNDDEIGLLVSWLKTGTLAHRTPHDENSLLEACTLLAEATGVSRICVTRAALGAVLWEQDNFVSATAPAIVVKDTVGAGDAFMAGLIVGLTRGTDAQKVLESACRLGAYVASHDGATPLLPAELIDEINQSA